MAAIEELLPSRILARYLAEEAGQGESEQRGMNNFTLGTSHRNFVVQKPGAARAVHRSNCMQGCQPVLSTIVYEVHAIQQRVHACTPGTPPLTLPLVTIKGGQLLQQRATQWFPFP